MFGQLFPARLRSAEKALKDGRLDEAFRLASSPDLRDHRRAGAVRSKLTKQFIARAREHYRSDRLTEALLDLEKASAGSGHEDEIRELREQVMTVAVEEERRAQSGRARVDDARRRIERGSLAAGRRILQSAAASDADAVTLKERAARGSAEVASLLQQAEQMIGQGQLAAAAERVQKAKSIEAHSERVTTLESRLCSLVLDGARSALVEGRILRARDELHCLGAMGNDLPGKKELTHMIELAVSATTALRKSRYTDAKKEAMSLGRLLPGAKWINDAVDRLDRIDDICTELLASPLGNADLGDGKMMPQDRQGQEDQRSRQRLGDRQRVDPVIAGLDDTVALPARAGVVAGQLPEHLLLLVDGGGSYLILRGDRTSIGRFACDHPADVPILSDIAERHANIARVDDDYFLFASKDVEVAGRTTRNKLLRDSDRIVLGRKAKFTFRLPSRRSTSAVLELSDSTRMPQDVRRIVLFDRHVTIGQSHNGHVYCRHASPPLILFEREGAMWLRPKNDGHVHGAAVKLELGVPTELCGVSLSLERWQLRRNRAGLA